MSRKLTLEDILVWIDNCVLSEAQRLVQYKTYIPEKKVWVSTIAWNKLIGKDWKSETSIFQGDENGVTDWTPLYLEPHGLCTDKEILKEKHKEVIRKLLKDEIVLEEAIDI